MKKHRIIKTGRKTLIPFGKIKFTSTPNPDHPTIRQASIYVQLTITIVRKSFKDTLVALVVICQLALSLVVNDLFYRFLKVLFPKVDDVLPRHSNTIRKWIMNAFELRKNRLKQSLSKCQSLVHFSFDLWTSPNHKALLGVVAHYINENSVLQSVS